MNKRYACFCTICLLVFEGIIPLQAQISYKFQKVFGGLGTDDAFTVQATPDSGYILIGQSFSFGAGGRDAWVVKTDKYGSILWSKAYGGADDDIGQHINTTADKGYILTGYTYGFGGSWNHTGFFVKIDSAGNRQWGETFGGPDYDDGNSVLQTPDKGYTVAGHTMSYGSGGEDAYLVHFDSLGNYVWGKAYGESVYEGFGYGTTMQITSDGGYILTGITNSFSGGDNFYLVKTLGDGTLSWAKCYGGSSTDQGHSVIQTADNGFVMVGSTRSFGLGNNFDVLLIKVDASGNVQFAKRYGGANDDKGYCVTIANDGGFVITGETRSFGLGAIDVYLLKTDANGNLLWSRSFGGNTDDIGRSIKNTLDGGYIIAGSTSSFGSGMSDYFLIKTDSEGNVGCNQSEPLTLTNSFTVTVAGSAQVKDGGEHTPQLVSASTASATEMVLCTAVPLEFISVSVRRLKDGNALKWKCESVPNAHPFIIEKSLDGEHFFSIGSVSDSKGSDASEYLFIDTESGNSSAYYRILRISYSGEFTYSQMVTISGEQYANDPFMIYPNLVSAGEKVYLNGHGDGTIKMYDDRGIKVFEAEYKESETMSVSTENFLPGIYVLRFFSLGSEHVKKLVIR